jgi:chaperonin cofactor prefoldin
MPTEAQLQEWHKAFSRIERVDDYQKLKALYSSIEQQIAVLEEDIPTFKAPRNPREDSLQLHSKNKLHMLKKQKERLEPKLKEFEKQIEADMEASKNELH